MMFFYLFILTVFFTTSNVKSIQQNLNFDDDIFYGDPFSLKKLHINKIKDQFSKSIQKPVISKIKNLNDYISNYKNHILKPSDFVVITKEKCLNFYNLKELFLKGNKNIQEIEANLLFISDYLNDLNYLFKDEYGNFLIFSVCKNLFLSSNGNLSNDNDNYIKCFQRFIFISKIDFSIYSFSFSGEKIPSLINFSVDFSIDEFTHKRVCILKSDN